MTTGISYETIENDNFKVTSDGDDIFGTSKKFEK